MQITRRKLFGSLLAVVAAPFAPKLQAKEEPPEVIIRAGDHGADMLEVYNQDTGEIARVALAVSIGRWVEILTYASPTWHVSPVTWKVTEHKPNGAKAQCYIDNELPTMRVPGNWQVRQKPAVAAKSKKGHQTGKDIFGYEMKPVPFPYPTAYQELAKS